MTLYFTHICQKKVLGKTQVNKSTVAKTVFGKDGCSETMFLKYFKEILILIRVCIRIGELANLFLMVFPNFPTPP